MLDKFPDSVEVNESCEVFALKQSFVGYIKC